MEFENPYQVSCESEPAQHDIQVSPPFLLMPKDSVLPECCVKCSEPAAKRYTQKLFWVSPWVYLCILINIFVLLIVYLITRKVTKVSYSLCTQHVQQKRMRAWILSAFGFGLIALLIAAAALESFIPVFLAIADLVGMIIYSMINPPALTVKKYKDERFWIKGAGEDLLARFQEQDSQEVIQQSPIV